MTSESTHADLPITASEKQETSPRRKAYSQAKAIMHYYGVPTVNAWGENITRNIPEDPSLQNPFYRYDRYSNGSLTEHVAATMIIDTLAQQPQSEAANKLLDLYVDTTWDEKRHKWQIVRMLKDVKAGKFSVPTKYDDDFVTALYNESRQLDPHNPEEMYQTWQIALSMYEDGADIIKMPTEKQEEINNKWKQHEAESFRTFANAVFSQRHPGEIQLEKIRNRLNENPSEFPEVRALLIKHEVS